MLIRIPKQGYKFLVRGYLLLGCLAISSGTLAETASTQISDASSAVVLIKAHLKHGLLEDDDATDRWTGSGFLIDRGKGWIVTNAHVSGHGPTNLRVRFEDQKQFTKAERVFVDSKYDVAIIKVDPE